MATPPASDPPFLDPDPPHWAARGLWYFLVLVFVLGLGAVLVVEIPESVSGAVTLVPRDDGSGALEGELLVPEASLRLVTPGQPVRLRLDAFPYQRYGARSGVVRSAPVPGAPVDGQPTFRVRFDLADTAIALGDRAQSLLPGMRGRGDILIGRRSLVRSVMGGLGR
jgi:membrane fusion protein